MLRQKLKVYPVVEMAADSAKPPLVHVADEVPE
jgi:hypothetical protein